MKDPFRKIWKAVVIATSSAVCLFCGPSPDIETIPKNALIVDVRTPQEFAEKHFQGAVNIPVSEIENRLSEFGAPDSEIVVYCRSGNRSGKAKQLLLEKGYSHVSNGGGLNNMLKMKRE